MDISTMFATVAMSLLCTVSSTKHVVYWDQDLIPKLSFGGLEINLEVDDYMDVLCPYANRHGVKSARGPRREELLLNIYNVTRSDYESCNTENGIMLQTCDSPYTEKKLTTKFQERSPYPFGFTFMPGATYYYISKRLDDIGSGCNEDTMRMMIHVHRRGRVASQGGRRRTITYHSKEKIDATQHDKKHDHSKTRHNHHAKASPSTTRQPFVIQYDYLSPKGNLPRVSEVRGSKHGGNSASVLSPSYSISVTISCAVYLLLNALLEIRDFA